MEPDICPPYWPAIIWWLIHHPPGPPPPWRTEVIAELDRYFASLATVALTTRLDRDLGRQVIGAMGKAASNPMAGFVNALTRG